jgi:hypothetical protein
MKTNKNEKFIGVGAIKQKARKARLQDEQFVELLIKMWI